MANDDVVGNLDRFINQGLPDFLHTGMLKAVSIVSESAQNKVPRDTGNLARSIDFDVEEDGTEGTIFSNCEYAPYVEIGTGIHSSLGNGRKDSWRYLSPHGWRTTSGQKAQPFLKPAVNENKQNILDCFEGLF